MAQLIPAMVFAALGLLVLAVPGAAWVAGFEASAGRQAPAIEGGALGRFMKSTLAAHLVLAPVSLMAVIWALRGSAGVDIHGGPIQAWIVPIAVLVAVLLVYAVGPLVLGYASGARVRSRGSGLLAGAVERIRERAEHGSVLSRLPAPSKGLLYPRAWDFVFSQNRPLYLRARLRSGRWIGGFVGRSTPIAGSWCGPTTVSTWRSPTDTLSNRRWLHDAEKREPSQSIDKKKSTRGYVIDSAKPSETKPPAGSGVSVGSDGAAGKNSSTKGGRRRAGRADEQ